MVPGQLSAEAYFKWDITVCRLQASSQEKIVLKQAVTLPMGLPREAVSRCLFQTKTCLKKYCHIYENIRKQLCFLLGAFQFYNLCVCIQRGCSYCTYWILLVRVLCVWNTVCGSLRTSTLASLTFQLEWWNLHAHCLVENIQCVDGKARHHESQQMLCGVCYCFCWTEAFVAMSGCSQEPSSPTSFHFLFSFLFGSRASWLFLCFFSRSTLYHFPSIHQAALESLLIVQVGVIGFSLVSSDLLIFVRTNKNSFTTWNPHSAFCCCVSSPCLVSSILRMRLAFCLCCSFFSEIVWFLTLPHKVFLYKWLHILCFAFHVLLTSPAVHTPLLSYNPLGLKWERLEVVQARRFCSLRIALNCHTCWNNHSGAVQSLRSKDERSVWNEAAYAVICNTCSWFSTWNDIRMSGEVYPQSQHLWWVCKVLKTKRS